MKSFELPINGVSVPVVINTLVQKHYAEAAGLKYVNETIQSLQSDVDKDGNVLISFELIDRYCQFIYAGIKEAARLKYKETALTLEDCYSIFDDVEAVKLFLSHLIGGMPVADTEKEEPTGNP